ncbi:MAG: TolB family protein [Thermomicrobiales bacterium]
MKSVGRRHKRSFRTALCALAVLLVPLVLPLGLRADPVSASALVNFADPAFRALWRRTDDLAQGRRSYLWGPIDRQTYVIAREPYADAPGGSRLVEYFDKTRMERTDPTGSRATTGFVTNGLLATEMITGRLQLGDKTFQTFSPATVPIAGDASDPDGPTYATFTPLTGVSPLAANAPITQTVDRKGTIGGGGPSGVTAGDLVPETNHRTASIFHDFIFASGPIIMGDQTVNGPLFANGYAGGVGFPITEAYWAQVRVGGIQKQVLVQAFERRVLTYTPDNPEGFKVEAGNVGHQYLRWRYGDARPPAPSQRVAFTAKSGGGPAALVVMDADGKNRATVASPSSDARSPSWSPDGTRIVYAAGGKLFVVGADGKNPTAVTDGANDDFPAWSSDGTRIAFTRGHDLALLSVPNGGVTTLFAGVPGVGAIAWSPDGTRVAMERGTNIWTLNTDGFGLQLVLAGTNGTAFRAPSWTPDGTRIVATREAGGTHTVIVTTTDGNDQRDLVIGSGGAVSADGLRDLVISPAGRLVVTNFQGLQPRFLSADTETAAFPTWSP